MQANSRIFSAEELVPEIKSIVDEGGIFPLAVTGISMRPFLTPSTDTVFIEKTTLEELNRGDIVFVNHKSIPLLHRVSKVTSDGFFMIGDAHVKSDGFFPFDETVGVVRYIRNEKTGKKRKANTPCIRFLVKMNRIRIHIFNFFKR